MEHLKYVLAPLSEVADCCCMEAFVLLSGFRGFGFGVANIELVRKSLFDGDDLALVVVGDGVCGFDFTLVEDGYFWGV